MQPEPPVAAVDRVARDEQVAQVGRDLRVAPFGGVALLQEARHLARAVGDQHGEEVVPVAQPHGDADGQGVDVLQDGAVLDAVEVGRVAQPDAVAGKFRADDPRILRIGARDGQVGELAARHLLGVRRPREEPDLLVRQSVMVVDVFGDGLVVARDDALDGRDDELVVKGLGQRFEKGLQVGRRGGQDEDFGVAHHLVQVVRRGDARAVELQVADVAGVAALGAQPFEHLGVADIPSDAGFVRGEQPCDGRGPASVSDDGAARLLVYFVIHAVRSVVS